MGETPDSGRLGLSKLPDIHRLVRQPAPVDRSPRGDQPLRRLLVLEAVDAQTGAAPPPPQGPVARGPRGDQPLRRLLVLEAVDAQTGAEPSPQQIEGAEGVLGRPAPGGHLVPAAGVAPPT